MPSNRYSETELQEQLKNRVARLLRFIRMNGPHPIIANEIAMIVTVARLCYGRDLVDERITQLQATTDALEAGLCGKCLTTPSLSDSDYCASCQRRADEVAVMSQPFPPDQPTS